MRQAPQSLGIQNYGGLFCRATTGHEPILDYQDILAKTSWQILYGDSDRPETGE